MASSLQLLRQRVGRSLAYGRQPTPAPRPYQEMGVAGTAVWGGYVQVKERSPEWIGRQKWITASDLAVNTSIVAAGVHYFLNLVAYPKWTISPSDESDEESVALAEFADHVLNDMTTPWYKVVRRAAMYRFHGFGIQEWTAKHRDDGLIGFKDIEARPQHTIEQWDIDIDGTVLGMWQRSPQTGHLLGLPRDKVLYLVEDTLTDNPEGIGMFRHMADPYRRLMQLQQLEIRAYERDMRGVPIARAPLTKIQQGIKQGSIKPEDASRLLSDLQSMVELQVKQSDTGIILDSLPYFSDSDAGDQVSGVPQWGFDLLSGSGVGHGEVAAAIDRIQREIARIIGVEHLMMGDMGGNRSLSEDKSRNLSLIANSVLKYLATQVRSDILIPLWRLNGFPMDKLPEAKPEDVTFKNAEAITNALHRLASAGAPLAPNDPVINDIRELLGVSRMPESAMAAGAMPPNPLLAGLPPELQLQLGGKGGPGLPGAGGPGAPPGLGSGGPGKLPGGGGGAMPGEGGEDPTKKFGKRPVPGRAQPAQEVEYTGSDRVPVDEAGNPVEEPKPDFNDPVAGPQQLPTRDPQVQALRSQQEQEEPDANVDPGAAQQGQGQEAPVEDVGAVAQAGVPGDEAPGVDIQDGGKVAIDARLLLRIVEQLTGGSAVAGAEPAAGAAGTPTAGAKPGSPLGAAVPTKAGPTGADPAAAAGGKGPDLAQQAKELAGAAGEPQPGQKPPGAGADGKPQLGPEGEVEGKPEPGSPEEAAAAAALGQQSPGMPGMPGAPAEPSPMENMDIERAVEVLQPYAEAAPVTSLDQTESRTEADILYTRLGEEKPVQAAVADRDPLGELDTLNSPTAQERQAVDGAGGKGPAAKPAQPGDAETEAGEPGVDPAGARLQPGSSPDVPEGGKAPGPVRRPVLGKPKPPGQPLPADGKPRVRLPPTKDKDKPVIPPKGTKKPQAAAGGKAPAPRRVRL